MTAAHKKAGAGILRIYESAAPGARLITTQPGIQRGQARDQAHHYAALGFYCEYEYTHGRNGIKATERFYPQKGGSV